MHFSLVRISTPHMPDTRAFDDVLLPLRYAFQHLGYETEIRINSFNPHSRNICLGANYDPEQRWLALPAEAVILNLEQLEATGYPWLKDGRYFDLLAGRETWDFSRRNIDFLAGRGIRARFLPLGYVPEMTRLAPCPAPTSDVLFYGAMTPRRREVLTALAERGLAVNRLTRAFGPARDQALYGTRVFLNIHHSLPASLEIVRLGYALANRRAVVSELAPGTYHYPELAGACAFGTHEELVPLVLDLVHDERQREEQARLGFEAFAALKLDEALAELVGRRLVHGQGADFAPEGPNAAAASSRPDFDGRDKNLTASPQVKPSCPDHLRIGSGPDFWNEALNVDADPRMRPDLVADPTRPLTPGASYPTERFGPVTLEPGSFQTISLPRLAAEVEDLDGLMTACLDLLRPGGELIVSGPHELAAEAPAARRAFNAASWRRYTDQTEWSGWTGARFELARLDYGLSDFGRARQAQGRTPEELDRTPGAVDRLRAVLRKRLLSPEEKTAAAETAAPLTSPAFRPEAPAPPAPTDLQTAEPPLTREIYTGPAIVWLVEDPDREVDPVTRPRLPSRWGLRWKLVQLRLRRARYRFNLRHQYTGRHSRYQDKLADLETEISEARRLLKLY